MHRALLDLLKDTITIEPWQDTDGFGAAGYAAGVQYPARVRGEMKLVRNRDGEEVMSTTRITVPGPPDGPDSIDTRSRITLANGTKSADLAVAEVKDELGTIDHFTVRLT